MDIRDQLKSKFKITCEKCGSENIEVDFSTGNKFCPSPALGWLEIKCNECNQKLDAESD